MKRLVTLYRCVACVCDGTRVCLLHCGYIHVCNCAIACVVVSVVDVFVMAVCCDPLCCYCHSCRNMKAQLNSTDATCHYLHE